MTELPAPVPPSGALGLGVQVRLIISQRLLRAGRVLLHREKLSHGKVSDVKV